MKKLTYTVFTLVFSVLLTVNAFAAPTGTAAIVGSEEIEGNILYVSLNFSGCTDVLGIQGTVIYNSTQTELLDFISELPQGYRFRYNDNGTGKITYLFYRTDDTVPAITGNNDLFNLYFRINTKPDDDTVKLSHAECQLFDEKTHISLSDSEYSAHLKNYVPPVTTTVSTTTAPPAPVTTQPATKPPVTVTPPTTPVSTDAPTEPITTVSPDTSTVPPESDTEEHTINSDTVLTEPPATTVGNDPSGKSTVVFIALAAGTAAAVISGTIVYIIMKKQMKNKEK